MPKTMRSGAHVARGATYLFVQGTFSIVISLAYSVILYRLLPLDEVGIYALLVIILSIVQRVGNFAFPSAATKYIAQYLGEGKLEEARSVVTRVLQICLLSSAILSIFLIVFAGSLSELLGGVPVWVFFTLAFAAFFTIISTVANAFLFGLQRIREVAATNLAYTVAQNVLGIYLLLAGWGLLGIVCSWLTGIAISSLAALALTAKFLGIRGKLHPTRPLINFSFPLYISAFVGIVASWVDSLFVLPFMGLDYLGIYSMAIKIYAIPSLISTSIVSALFPKLSELYAQGGVRSLREAFRTSTRYVAFVGFPLVIGLAALSYPIIIGLVTEKYVKAVQPLFILSIAAIPLTWGSVIRPTLLTLERTWVQFVRQLALILSNTFICYVTLAFLNLGMLGASSARVISTFISFGIGVYALRKGLGISFDKEAIWKALTASLIMAAAVTLSRFLEGFVSQPYLVYLLPFYMIVGAAAYFFALIALRAIKKQDLEIMHDYLPGELKRLAVWLGRIAFIE